MKKVVAYCRVSTDSNDQINSLKSQERYFKEFINKNPDYELVAIYADEGVTGTSTKKRKAFNKMIADCELGKVDLILTKEISRFARNTLDSIHYTRMLKAMGIGVIFMNEDINTLNNDGELRLTIMSSIAQDESRKTSERVKWGQQRQMERGVAFGANVFGYDHDAGKLLINQKEAEVVKHIFYKYLEEGKGLNRIAKELEEEGVLTKKKNKTWTANSISRLLKNEKYCGDLVQRKTYTADYLTREKKINKGEEDFIIRKDNHEPIISRETFERTQLELAKRTNVDKDGTKYSNRYPFSGRLKCGICGASFISRNKVENKDKKVVYRWGCSTHFKYGKKNTNEKGETVGCESYLIRDDVLQHIFMLSLRDFIKNKQAVIDNVMAAVLQVVKPDASKDEKKGLTKELENLNNKKQQLIDRCLDLEIDTETFKKMIKEYDLQITNTKEKINAFDERNIMFEDFDKIIERIKTHITNIVFAETFSDELAKELLDKIVINSKTMFDVYFKGCKDKFSFAKDGCKSLPKYLFAK